MASKWRDMALRQASRLELSRAPEIWPHGGAEGGELLPHRLWPEARSGSADDTTPGRAAQLPGAAALRFRARWGAGRWDGPARAVGRGPLDVARQGGPGIRGEVAERRDGADAKRSRALWELFLASAFVLVDVSLFMFEDASKASGGAFAREALLTVVAAASLLVGVAVSWWKDGWAGVPKMVFRLSHGKVLLQLRLPATVLLSMAVLGRRYRFYQVQGLTNVFLGVVAFTLLRAPPGLAPAAPRAAGEWLGLGLVACQIGCSVLASVLAERSLGSTEGVPFYTAIAQLKAGELAVALASMCLLPGRAFEPGALLRRPSAMLEGFGRAVPAGRQLCTPVWLLALCLLADGWMSALVVRSLSSVAKLIAKCLSLSRRAPKAAQATALSGAQYWPRGFLRSPGDRPPPIVLYLVALACRSEPFALPRFLLALLVVSGTVQFAYASRRRGGARAEAEPLTAAERAQIEAAFRRFDSDGDGDLELAEFDAMLCHLGAKLAGPQLQQAFEELDLNGDGRVCVGEFAAFWESQPRLRGYSAPGLTFLRLRRGALDAR
ncbi:unnamed protein product [Prorocentrum cordatum]|uniref:EF-hand domain-containing protein n=1 Tax=Prorocentrum cordatum TaxID=2364126 RepID=A0ABN9PCM7_9DINO|nr:unnamed protein product [Polarella glacialis]